MAELKVGLAPNRTSYYDKLTNTYITLEKPVQNVSYNENDMPGTVKRLDKITHALLASVPALVLHQGQLPVECIEAFKEKYMKPFYGLKGRTIVAGQAVVTGNMPIADQMLDRNALGTANTNEPLRDGVDYVGAEVKPNRAFDRAEKMIPDVPVEPEEPIEPTEPEEPTDPTPEEPTEPEEPVEGQSTKNAEEVIVEDGQVMAMELVKEEPKPKKGRKAKAE